MASFNQMMRLQKSMSENSLLKKFLMRKKGYVLVVVTEILIDLQQRLECEKSVPC